MLNNSFNGTHFIGNAIALILSKISFVPNQCIRCVDLLDVYKNLLDPP